MRNVIAFYNSYIIHVFLEWGFFQLTKCTCIHSESHTFYHSNSCSSNLWISQSLFFSSEMHFSCSMLFLQCFFLFISYCARKYIIFQMQYFLSWSSNPIWSHWMRLANYEVLKWLDIHHSILTSYYIVASLAT